MGHVEVDGRPGGEEFVERVGRVLDGADVVVLTPVVEPADPELHGRERTGLLVAAQGVEAFGGPRAEGGGGEAAGDHAALQHGVLGASAARQQRQQLGDDQVEPAVHLGLEARVGAAQVESVDGEEAGGQAAEVPFGADVRAGADDGVEAEVLGDAQEAAEVAGPVKSARPGAVSWKFQGT